jgi:hypothetical protein
MLFLLSFLEPDQLLFENRNLVLKLAGIPNFIGPIVKDGE